jgi:hypothetical protein
VLLYGAVDVCATVSVPLEVVPVRDPVSSMGTEVVIVLLVPVGDACVVPFVKVASV